MHLTLCLLAVLAASMLLAAGGAGVGDADDDAARKELRALEGTWTAVSMEAGGSPVPMEAVGAFTFAVAADGRATGKSAQGEYVATMTIEPGKSPKALVLLHETGAHKGKRQYGVYKLEKDTWTVCITAPGAAAADGPKGFDTKDTGNVVFVFERAKARP